MEKDNRNENEQDSKVSPEAKAPSLKRTADEESSFITGSNEADSSLAPQDKKQKSTENDINRFLFQMKENLDAKLREQDAKIEGQEKKIQGQEKKIQWQDEKIQGQAVMIKELQQERRYQLSRPAVTTRAEFYQQLVEDKKIRFDGADVNDFLSISKDCLQDLPDNTSFNFDLTESSPESDVQAYISKIYSRNLKNTMRSPPRCKAFRVLTPIKHAASKLVNLTLSATREIACAH